MDSLNSLQFYHVTPSHNVANIMDNGIRPSVEGELGAGVYLSKNLDDAKNLAISERKLKGKSATNLSAIHVNANVSNPLMVGKHSQDKADKGLSFLERTGKSGISSRLDEFHNAINGEGYDALESYNYGHEMNVHPSKIQVTGSTDLGSYDG